MRTTVQLKNYISQRGVRVCVRDLSAEYVC